MAIGKAVEEELGKRQGQRTDLVSEEQESLVEILPQVEQANSGQKTREVAAKKAGFGSDKTYRDAKTVTENATPELIEAMDKGDIAISTAAKLADCCNIRLSRSLRFKRNLSSHPPPRSLTAATRSEKSSLLKVRVASTTPACRPLQRVGIGNRPFHSSGRTHHSRLPTAATL